MVGHSGAKSLWRLTALLLALTASALAACKSVPLAPAPHLWAASTPEHSRDAIIAALIRYGYVVDEEAPGVMRARLQKNAWSMIVEVRYDEKEISVNYADSHNLMYEVRHDVPYIHKGYNARAQELADEIKRQISIVELKSRPMPTAASPTTAKPPPPAPPAPSSPPPPAPH
jgi:hypothetical protein